MTPIPIDSAPLLWQRAVRLLALLRMLDPEADVIEIEESDVENFYGCV